MVLASLVVLYQTGSNDPHSLLLDRSTWNALATKRAQVLGMLPVRRLLPRNRSRNAVPLAAHSGLKVPAR